MPCRLKTIIPRPQDTRSSCFRTVSDRTGRLAKANTPSASTGSAASRLTALSLPGTGALLGEAGADETRGFVAASKTRSLRLRYPYKTADGAAVGKKSDPRKARLVSTSERSFSCGRVRGENQTPLRCTTLPFVMCAQS